MKSENRLTHCPYLCRKLLALALISCSPLLAQDAEKAKIEAEYMDQAKENIEKYRKSDASITMLDKDGNPLTGVELRIEQISQDFLFGNTVFELTRPEPKVGPGHSEFKQRYGALFNHAVLPFYWSNYEDPQGKPEWQGMQEAIDWCLQNGIELKGHPLGWTHPAGTPSWLLDLPKDTAFDLYKARIYNNVRGFKGMVDKWDVVNEPVTTVPMDRVFIDPSNEDTRIGEGARYEVSGIPVSEVVPWVEKSFKWAFDANPGGHFILNDFNLIAVPETRERFYQLMKELLERGAPVSGIGIQGHEPREMWYSPVELRATFERLDEFGLPLHITELIPQSSGKRITGGWREGRWTEEAQAAFAEQFYTLAFGHPSVESITWWGLSDRDIWLEGGGLLDEEYNPKPVYNTLMNLIKNDWMTKDVSVTTDRRGRASFRGFHGEYRISLTRSDGSKQTLLLNLRKNEDNQWTFRL